MDNYEKIISNVLKLFKRIDNSTKEDIEQDLRMYIFENPDFDKLNENVVNHEGYIFIILKRQAINLIKSKKYRKWSSLNVEGNNKQDLVSSVIYDDELQKIEEQALQVLEFVGRRFGDTERKILELYYFENLTFKKIGEVIELSTNTVRRKFKKIIEESRRWFIKD